jgi:hypothetical protein
VLFSACKSGTDAPSTEFTSQSTESTEPAESKDEPAQSIEPTITKDDVLKILGNLSTSEETHTFEFQTKEYKTRGGFLGFGKINCTLKISGSVALSLSSDRSVVIDSSEKTISISMGKINAVPTTNTPEKWELVAVDEKDQPNLNKLADGLGAAFAKDAKDDEKSIFDKETKSSIRAEIDEVLKERARAETEIFATDTASSIENQLKRNYEIGDYTIKIIFE